MLYLYIGSQAGPATISVDELANIIRKVDGEHKLGASALAEAILGEMTK